MSRALGSIYSIEGKGKKKKKIKRKEGREGRKKEKKLNHGLYKRK
jgi:hypothetical protein